MREISLEQVRARLETEHPEDRAIDHRGWRFTSPFHCFYCGVKVPAYQFAFSRSCGGCDVGVSYTRRLHPGDRRAFAGPHERIGKPSDRLFISPKWLDPARRDEYPVLLRIPLRRKPISPGGHLK